MRTEPKIDPDRGRKVIGLGHHSQVKAFQVCQGCFSSDFLPFGWQFSSMIDSLAVQTTRQIVIIRLEIIVIAQISSFGWQKVPLDRVRSCLTCDQWD